MHIEQLIDTISKRTGMFVKEERIDYIYYLIVGHCGAKSEFLVDDMDKKFCIWFGKWLLIWIENNIDSEYLPESVYWYEDIVKIAGDEQKAIDMFYKLSKEFFYDYHNKKGYFSWRNE